MNRPLLTAAAILLVITMPAVAGDGKNSAVTPRQMANCMVKRMKASRTESYRDAFNGCKEQFASAQRDRTPESAMNSVNNSVLQKQ